MHKAFFPFIALIVAGCATDVRKFGASPQVVLGSVSSYEPVVALSHGDRAPRYYSHLNIIAPTALVGRVMSIISHKALPNDHPLTKKGSTVEIKIRGLEDYRGVEYRVEPFSGIVHYFVPIEAVVINRVAKDPNQAPEPTSLRLTPRADARGAPAAVVAHL